MSLEQRKDEEVVSLVKSEPPLPFDTDIEVERGDNDTDHKILVRVVAPYAIPARHLFAVKIVDTGETYDVRVPEPGFEKGQEFEAEARVRLKRSITLGRFSDGLFDFGNLEGGFLVLTWCCPGIAFASIMDKMGLGICGGGPISNVNTSTRNRARKKALGCTFAVASIVWSMYYITLYCRQAPLAPLWVYAVNIVTMPWVIIMFTRTVMTFRKRHRIPGNCCMDCLQVHFCTWCTALRLFRHMKRSGDRPVTRFCERTAKATIV